MSAQIISGKELSAEIREELKQKVKDLKAKGKNPGLVVILVGDDPASAVYVNNKEKACQETGIYSEVLRLPASTSQEELLRLIDKYNNDPKLSGILVQLPLPGHIDEAEVIRSLLKSQEPVLKALKLLIRLFEEYFQEFRHIHFDRPPIS
jgi:methylenetetrahydrofolate dehydrogenase (NADP+)/methenyltetrahydrofolate cyclohydrolase